MAKQNRGKALWRLPSRGRGTCPACGSTRIKLLYTLITDNGDKLKVCKKCRSRAKSA